MRILVLVITSLLSTSLLAEAPQVPSSIEIAGVKLKINGDAQEEIQKHVNALRASDKYFRIKLDRVNLYFPIVERVLREEGVPEDLKYLAIQESALISDAVSSSNAVGYWQFKDFTAREVGLRVDSKIDERKNIVSATRGAAKYFKRNNFFFNNWIYAVSAYQAGPGGAKQYVDKENFGSDKLTITKKTHWYVLKYIAHVIAFQNEIGEPHSEGLKLAEYTRGEGKSIEQVAKELSADEDLTKDYNKWLLHGKVPDDKQYTVIVPMTGKIPDLLAQGNSKDKSGNPPLSRSIKEPEKNNYPDRIAGDIISKKQSVFLIVNGIQATMASNGDDVQSLSKKAGIDPSRFLSYNDMKSTATVQAGQIYYVSRKKNKSAIYHHVAQYDESLWEISQKYGIKLDQLKKRNRMSDNETLKPGRLMWLHKKRPTDIPVEYHKVEKPRISGNKTVKTPIKTREPIVVKTEPEVSEPEKFTDEERFEPKNIPDGDRIIHIIQPGETFHALSKRYNVEVSEIADWNGRHTNSTLSIGDEIVIYRPKQNYSAIPVKAPENETIAELSGKVDNVKKDTGVDQKESKTSQIHIVQPGEGLWAISKKYDVTVAQILEWNGLNDPNQIQPEQQLIVGDKKEQPYSTYTVKGGDSLYKISLKFDMTVEEIMKLNNMSDSNLSVGDELKVRKK